MKNFISLTLIYTVKTFVQKIFEVILVQMYEYSVYIIPIKYDVLDQKIKLCRCHKYNTYSYDGILVNYYPNDNFSYSIILSREIFLVIFLENFLDVLFSGKQLQENCTEFKVGFLDRHFQSTIYRRQMFGHFRSVSQAYIFYVVLAFCGEKIPYTNDRPKIFLVSRSGHVIIFIDGGRGKTAKR